MPADNQKAIAVCSSFDNFRKDKDTISAVKLAGGETIDLKNFYNTFHKVDSMIGNLKSFEVVNASSDIEGRNGIEQGEYSVEFKCIYERGTAKETFYLTSDSKCKIHIEGFHVSINL